MSSNSRDLILTSSWTCRILADIGQTLILLNTMLEVPRTTYLIEKCSFFVIEINDMAFCSKTTQSNTSMHTTAKVCFAMHNFDKLMQQPRKLDVIEVGQGK